MSAKVENNAQQKEGNHQLKKVICKKLTPDLFSSFCLGFSFFFAENRKMYISARVCLEVGKQAVQIPGTGLKVII